MMFYSIIRIDSKKGFIMKNIIYILLLIPVISMAGLNIEKINNTLSNIKSSNSTKVTFFNKNKKIDLIGQLKFTSSSKASIILFSNSKQKVTIVNSYKALKMNKNSIGAIYVKKGRTQIVFVKERLKRNGFFLPNSLKKHLLSECQLSPICLLKR